MVAVHLPTTSAMEWVIVVAAFFTAVALLWTRWLGPWIGRPIGRAIRGELEEVVEQIVVRLQNELLHRVGSHEARLIEMEVQVGRLDGRLQVLEADHSGTYHRSQFPSHTHKEQE